jgi:hypothetical protein
MTWSELGVVCALGLAALDGVLLAALARKEESLSDTEHGLPLGTAIPAFEAVALDGSSVTEQHAFGKVVLFLGTQCQPCHQLAHELRRAQPAERASLLTIVADRGDDPPGADILSELDFLPGSRVIHDRPRFLTERLAMPGLPFAYAVDRRGSIRAKRAVRSVETLRGAVRATGRRA